MKKVRAGGCGLIELSVGAPASLRKYGAAENVNGGGNFIEINGFLESTESSPDVSALEGGETKYH
jgi:hypothetical protein